MSGKQEIEGVQITGNLIVTPAVSLMHGQLLDETYEQYSMGFLPKVDQLAAARIPGFHLDLSELRYTRAGQVRRVETGIILNIDCETSLGRRAAAYDECPRKGEDGFEERGLRIAEKRVALGVCDFLKEAAGQHGLAFNFELEDPGVSFIQIQA